jgi:hypothetical protein
MNPNTKFKDSVFSSLFSNPVLLRELYCALSGIKLPPDTPVEITTLQDVLFMDMINDISFIIAAKLIILIEHQSTINPNMALRLLLYAARLYEKIVADKNLYSTRAIKIPRPEFYVLYNGTAEYPDKRVMKLSDMFESVEGLGLADGEKPMLDLEVKVFNINEGKNVEVLKRSSALAGYSVFVGKTREYAGAGMKLEEAIKAAVAYCRRHDILKEYLEKHSSEVNNMLLTNWNWDDAKAVWQEEAREEGMAQGIEQGMAQGMAQSYTDILKLIAAGYTAEQIKSHVLDNIDKSRSGH